jgi:hypothetical protein
MAYVPVPMTGTTNPSRAINRIYPMKELSRKMVPNHQARKRSVRASDFFHRQPFRADDGAEAAVQAGGTASRPAKGSFRTIR